MTRRISKLLVLSFGLLVVARAYPVMSVGAAAVPVSAARSTVSAPTGASAPVAHLLAASVGAPITPTNPYFTSESNGNNSFTAHPAAVGDLVVLSMQLHTLGISITGITGGNVSGWVRAATYENNTTDTLHYEVWWGIADAAGPSTASIAYSSTGVNSWPVELISDSFTTGSAAMWSVVANGGNSGIGNPVLWPSLPSGTAPSQLYWGASEEETAGGSTSTSGFISQLTPHNNCFLYNGTIATSNPGAPDCSATGSAAWTAAGVTFAASTKPVVSSINPTSGALTGGTSVTVAGAGLTGATAVNFGGSPGTITSNPGDTSVTATAPAGSGTVNVTVTTAGGTSASVPADAFTYVGPPVVSQLSPAVGPTAGGTVVTITGSNLGGATAVQFGGSPATGITADSATSVTAIAPAGSGMVDVTVRAAGGTSGPGPADRYTYVPAPAVSGVSPAVGPTVGGNTVTITGANLGLASAVHFGASPATGITSDTATSVTVTAPAGSGTVDVTVTTPGGTSGTGAADRYQYVVLPAVSQLSPAAGPSPGGNTVIITGSDLAGATAVHFGPHPATEITANTATSATVTAPGGSGTVDVTVTTSTGTSAFGAADTYTYSPDGYVLVGSDGGIFNYGDAGFFGSAGALRLNKPIVGVATTPDGKGYWLVATDGGIFNYGDAGFFGSTGALRLNKPIVGMAATPDGNGYWLVASDGGIFAFGDAGYSGSAGALRLNKPIVGMATTSDGQGYWLVASDGGIFAFGDAVFRGSAGALRLNQPIVGMAATPDGQGYWLVSSDGGIFGFGDAGFFGSQGGSPLNKPIVGMATTPDGKGYWMVASDGGIFAFGDAGFAGSHGGSPLNKPIVGLAATA